MTESQAKVCQNCHGSFVIEPEDFQFYEKIQVPPPTWCPECRNQRRLAFRNERSLHKRKCDFSGENMISLYPPNTPFPVYQQKYWWSDKWDPLSYGKEINWNEPFLKQIQELRNRTPRMNLIGLHQTLENSEYVNMAHNLKNCYLIFNSDYNENCLYGSEIESSKDCIDNLMIDSCTLCYDCINCNKCYKTFFSEDCNECNDVYFSKDCIGCNNCFGCVNLRKKSHHIFNKPYTREEYEARIKEYNLSSRASLRGWQKKTQDFWETKGKYKHFHGLQNDDVSGDYINNSKNIHNCFIVRGSKNCKYCMWLIVGNNEDCYDYAQFGQNTELMYEVMQAGYQTSNVKFSYLVAAMSSSIEYSDSVYGSSNCFGCSNLRDKEYCILNKQYSKEEYNEFIPKIKKHMNEKPYVDKKGRVYKYGEFFPIELSVIPYNQSSAQDFYPLSEKDAEEKGYSWSEIKLTEHEISLSFDKIPDTIDKTDDTIIKEVIACRESGKAFRIVPDELRLHRVFNLPLPDCLPEVRQKRRIGRRNKPVLYNRACAKCGKGIQTSYASERPEVVYCEQCYNAEVV